MTYPLNLPSNWHQVWNYTYTQAEGSKLRIILRHILYKNILDQFRPIDVITGNIFRKYNTGTSSYPLTPTSKQMENVIRYYSINDINRWI